MSYRVINAVDVRAMDGERPRTIRLGIATDEKGRTLFGVCVYDDPAHSLRFGPLDVLSSMCYAVRDGFDPETALARAKVSGWFVLHAATPLKISAMELEVALYKLKLISRVGVEVEHTPEGESRLVRREDNQITVSAKDLEDVLRMAFWEAGVEDRPVLDRLRRALEEHRGG